MNSGRSIHLSANDMMTLRRIANGGAVIALLRNADVEHLKKLKLIDRDAIRVHLTERGREFLASQEAGE